MRKNLHLGLCVLLLLLTLAFIWGNSALPGAASQGISDGMLIRFSFLQAILGPNASRVIRKLAHLAEFGCLGLLLARLWQLLGQSLPHRLALAAFSGLLVSCVDETIQLYAVNRSSSLLDVWLDMVGICAGLLFALLVWWLGRRAKAASHASRLTP